MEPANKRQRLDESSFPYDSSFQATSEAHSESENSSQIPRLPPEILAQFFRLFKEEELFPLRGVCREWKILIDRDSTLRKRIFCRSLMREAKEGALTMDSLRSDIARVEAFYDVENAKMTAKKINDPLYKACALAFIGRIEARVDLKRAKETLELVQDRLSKGLAYVHIVEHLAAYDTDGALEIAQGFGDDDYLNNKLHSAIAIALAKVNPSRAGEIATRIRDPDTKEYALCKIVEIAAKKSVQEALSLAEEITISKYKDAASFAIVVALAGSDLSRAKEIAQTIANSDMKWRAELAIVKTVAKNDLKAAKAMARGFKSQEKRDEAFFTIVKMETPDVAKRTVLRIKDTYRRAMAFYAIAKADPRHDLTKTKEAAREIVQEDLKFKIFKAMAILDPIREMTPFQTMAQSIHRRTRKEFKLFELSFVQALSSLERGLATAARISSYIARSSAYLEIIERAAMSDPVSARKAARAIEESVIKTQALIKIGEVVWK